MSKSIFFLLLNLSFINCWSQANMQQANNPPLVHVQNWSEIGLFFTPNWFDDKQEEILKQISKDEFEKVKLYCSQGAWPKEMQYDNHYVYDTIGRKEWGTKLSLLKMYKIAIFRHLFQGKDWGNYVILRVPYAENAKWNSSTKWNDNIYIVTKEDNIVADK